MERKTDGGTKRKGRGERDEERERKRSRENECWTTNILLVTYFLQLEATL